MVPQCVSCIAASKLFVCIEKKKLETFLVFVWKPLTVTPPALCSSHENVFGKIIFFLNRKIISFEEQQKDREHGKKVLRYQNLRSWSRKKQ